MKKLFAFMLCILVQQAYATIPGKTSLSGKITDKKTHEALPGVEVYFPDLKMGASTKADGTFFIDQLPAIKTLITVHMTGYAAISEQIDLSVTTQKDFELDASVTELKQYVVTGTSHATEVKRNPVPIVIIDQHYLSQNPSSNIIDAMAKIPGVSALSTGPNISKPYIRGLGYNRVLSLYDGVRQDGQQWGDEHGIEIDQFLVDRIEVVKGPASLIYGSDAMAGVVNFLPAEPVAPGTVNGSLLMNYQSNNNQLAGSFAMNGNQKGITWGLRASHKQASDFRNRIDGRVFGTKYNETDLNLNAGLYKSWGYSYLNFSAFNDVQEVPDGSRDSLTRKFTKQITEEDTFRPIVSDDELSSYTIGLIHQRVQHYRVYSSSNFRFGSYSLAVKLAAQQSIRQEFSHPENPEQAGLQLTMNTYSYDLKFTIPEKGKWGLETTLGANGMFQTNSNKGATEFVIPDYTSFDAGPFLFMKKTVGKLDVAFGARYDVRIFRNDSLFTRIDPASGFDTEAAYVAGDTTLTRQFGQYKHTFSGFSGSAGATYNFSNKLGLKMNVSRGYRAPNVAEISAQGVHPGTGFEQLGEANLKPEFSLQEDLGIVASTEHISASLELFNNNISNYIYDEKLQSVNGGDSLLIQGSDEFPVYKFRQTKAQLFGGEFSFDLHPHPLDWLHFENSISLLYAVNRGGNGATINDSTRYLPFIPPLHTNTELRADIKKAGNHFASVYFKIGFQYYAEQNRAFLAYGTETVTPGYFLLDAGMGADIVNKKGYKLFTLDLSGNNLTDEAYQSNMSRMKYMDNYPVNGSGHSGIYSMGRNFSVRLLIPIGVVKPKEAEGGSVNEI